MKFLWVGVNCFGGLPILFLNMENTYHNKGPFNCCQLCGANHSVPQAPLKCQQ